MNLTILDLIREVGAENVYVQPLGRCIVGAQLKKRGGTEVQFMTDQMTPSDLMPSAKPEKVAYICWVSADKVREIQAKYEALPDEPTGK